VHVFDGIPVKTKHDMSEHVNDDDDDDDVAQRNYSDLNKLDSPRDYDVTADNDVVAINDVSKASSEHQLQTTRDLTTSASNITTIITIIIFKPGFHYPS